MATWMQANNRAPSWSLYPHQSLNSCFETSADIHLEHRHVHNWCSTVSVGFFWMFYMWFNTYLELCSILKLSTFRRLTCKWTCPWAIALVGTASSIFKPWGIHSMIKSPVKMEPAFFFLGFLWFSSMCIVKEHACMHISTYTCQTCHICNKQLSACYISVCVVKWYSILYYIYIYMYTCACRL